MAPRPPGPWLPGGGGVVGCGGAAVGGYPGGSVLYIAQSVAIQYGRGPINKFDSYGWTNQKA